MSEDISNAILAVREGISAGRYVNEAAVSGGIVRRVLDALSWPVYEPDVVAPEYSLEGRRVDYALCHPRGKPVVFIEVKQIGQIGGADRQLFEYAFYRGVPLAILTDGQEWHFFLPAEQGTFSDRRVYRLDLLERTPQECVERMRRYLDYKRICSGEAFEAARQDYRDVTKERQIRATLPEAWRKLVEEPDELLVELVADKVESLCGYKPSPDQVAVFLTRNMPSGAPEVRSERALSAMRGVEHPHSRPKSPTEQTAPSAIGFTLAGKWTPARSAREVLISLLQQLHERDPRFLERLAALPKHGNKVRFVARSKRELNPARPDLAENAREVVPGWWVYLYLSREAITKVI